MSENFTSQTLQLLHKVLTRVYKAVYAPLSHCPDLLVFGYTLPCLLCSSHIACFVVPFAQSVLSTWNILLSSHMANSLTCFKSFLKYHLHEAHWSIYSNYKPPLCLHPNPLILCFLFLQDLSMFITTYLTCLLWLLFYLFDWFLVIDLC